MHREMEYLRAVGRLVKPRRSKQRSKAKKAAIRERVRVRARKLDEVSR